MLDKHKNLMSLLGSLFFYLGKSNFFSYTLWLKRFGKFLLSADCVIKIIGVFCVMLCNFFPQIHTYIIIPDGLLDFTRDSLEFCSK